MKKIILSLSMLFTLNAYAESPKAFLESPQFDQFCEKIIVERAPFESIGTIWKHIYLLREPSFAQDDNYLYMGVKVPHVDLGDYPIHRANKQNPNEVTEIVRLKIAPLDFVLEGDNIWALYPRRILRVNSRTWEEHEIVLSKELLSHKQDRAYDLVYANKKIYIAHGTRGLIVVNPDTKMIERDIDLGLVQSNGHKSLAVSLTAISNQELIVGVDNLTLPMPGSNPFNGLVTVNIFSYSSRKYPYQSGIISRQSRLNFDGKTLWVNNAGTLQYLDIEKLKKKGAANTGWINLTYFEGDKKFSAEVRGDFFVLGKDIYTCSVRKRIMTTLREPRKGIAYRIKNGGVVKVNELKKLNLNVDYNWVSGPFVSDHLKSTIQIDLTDKKGTVSLLPQGMEMAINAYMPSMGHSGFDMGFFVQTEPGSYVNSDLMLGMPGDWVIELRVLDQNKKIVDSVKLEEYL